MREAQYFDNIGNNEIKTYRNFEMVDSGSADGCWVDALTEPIVEALTRLPRSVLANDFRSAGTAVCCGHGSSRVGSPHARLLAAGGGIRVSAEAGQFSRWGRDARLTRRVREEPPPGELGRLGLTTGC